MKNKHGCIRGKNHHKKAKTFPTVALENVPASVDTVRLRAGLYTVQGKHHVHKIMSKQLTEQDFIEVEVSRKNGFQHVWEGLRIINTRKRNFEETLFSRIRKIHLEQKGMKTSPDLTDPEEVQLKSEAAKMAREMEDKLNTVLLGFEAFRVENGISKNSPS